jgi:hypothetical protein
MSLLSCRYSVLMALMSTDLNAKKKSKNSETPDQWVKARYENIPDAAGYDVDHMCGALFFLRSFESLPRLKKLQYGKCLRS